MVVRHENLFKCLVSLQNTLSVCSKSLDCCTQEEKDLYGELSEDVARMIKRVKKEYHQ